ncbi:hypothetical protein CDL12_06655 [Handroanthus impetiginosus]|uniref:Uncharacterized protein n=1 Tax=Handroanthus impetiginosus TaxID=429701 RepID=A0A2G9HT02_9LAMI|nr:hypothetical protein CDL12_06655 [Handroanthus impetiginosus]
MKASSSFIDLKLLNYEFILAIYSTFALEPITRKRVVSSMMIYPKGGEREGRNSIPFCSSKEVHGEKCFPILIYTAFVVTCFTSVILDNRHKSSSLCPLYMKLTKGQRSYKPPTNLLKLCSLKTSNGRRGGDAAIIDL